MSCISSGEAILEGLIEENNALVEEYVDCPTNQNNLNGCKLEEFASRCQRLVCKIEGLPSRMLYVDVYSTVLQNLTVISIFSLLTHPHDEREGGSESTKQHLIKTRQELNRRFLNFLARIGELGMIPVVQLSNSDDTVTGLLHLLSSDNLMTVSTDARTVLRLSLVYCILLMFDSADGAGKQITRLMNVCRKLNSSTTKQNDSSAPVPSVIPLISEYSTSVVRCETFSELIDLCSLVEALHSFLTGNYSNTLQQIENIQHGDKLGYLPQYLTALTLYQMKSYKQALQVTETLKQCDEISDWLLTRVHLLQASVLSALGHNKLSIRVYLSCMENSDRKIESILAICHEARLLNDKELELKMIQILQKSMCDPGTESSVRSGFILRSLVDHCNCICLGHKPRTRFSILRFIAQRLLTLRRYQLSSECYSELVSLFTAPDSQDSVIIPTPCAITYLHNHTQFSDDAGGIFCEAALSHLKAGKLNEVIDLCEPIIEKLQTNVTQIQVNTEVNEGLRDCKPEDWPDKFKLMPFYFPDLCERYSHNVSSRTTSTTTLDCAVDTKHVSGVSNVNNKSADNVSTCIKSGSSVLSECVEQGNLDESKPEKHCQTNKLRDDNHTVDQITCNSNKRKRSDSRDHMTGMGCSRIGEKGGVKREGVLRVRLELLCAESLLHQGKVVQSLHKTNRVIQEIEADFSSLITTLQTQHSLSKKPHLTTDGEAWTDWIQTYGPYRESISDAYTLKSFILANCSNEPTDAVHWARLAFTVNKDREHLLYNLLKLLIHNGKSNMSSIIWKEYCKRNQRSECSNVNNEKLSLSTHQTDNSVQVESADVDMEDFFKRIELLLN